jgi:outer membrane protein assembly factor BamB
LAFPPARTLAAGIAFPVAAALTCLLGGCGASSAKDTWSLPAADLSGTRAAVASPIDRRTVARLGVRWRFRLTGEPSFAGLFASTPVADADTVYVQDLRSNVFALDRASGALRWKRRFGARNDGPNGLAVDGSRVYGATDADAFALDRSSGKLLWRRHLTGRSEQFVDVAPVVWKGLVFTSTIGYSPFGRGTIYALDAATGAVRWRFLTIEKPWRFPLEAGGGGLWYPVTVDRDGLLYAGNSNPTPWGGTPERPNGAAFPGPVPYTDSLLVLDARTGRLVWHDQVTAHDVRDYDFAATPILATVDGDDVVIGAGKAGRVIAWDRTSRRRLWSTAVGLHRNDLGPLPERRVTVCPGLLGGVETPMAYAGGRVFVPVVDLCGPGSATTRQDVAAIDPFDGRGRLVALDAASGRVAWQRRLPAPDFGCAAVSNDVVFTSTYDGTVYGLSTHDGSTLWRVRLRAGVNACPAVAGGLLLVGAGVRTAKGSVPELVAFGLG